MDAIQDVGERHERAATLSWRRVRLDEVVEPRCSLRLMKEAIGSSPDARVMMPEVRGDHGWMRSRQAASSRTVEILGRGISPWRRQPVSNHTSTEDSLQDSEPLFRRPTRVVCTSFYTV